VITSRDYFNPSGTDDSRIIGNPTGFVDFNDTSLRWANNTYDLMNALTWFPSEVDISNEAKNFNELDENEKNIFKIVFANLSFLDSSQESHILDFRANVTHRVLRSTLALQAVQEANHSKSYSTVLDQIGNSEEVFNMYKTEQVLMDRNNRVAELFARHISGTTSDKLLNSAVASVLLEGILFLTSFGYVFHMGDKMQGSRDIVAFIAKDEINAHAPLFANIFKNIVKQNNISSKAIDECYKMIDDAVNIEIDFGKHICSTYPVLGITEHMVETTVKNFANNRLKAIGLKPVYQNMPDTHFQKILDKVVNVNNVKSNVFESNNKSYAKDSINMDF